MNGMMMVIETEVDNPIDSPPLLVVGISERNSKTTNKVLSCI